MVNVHARDWYNVSINITTHRSIKKQPMLYYSVHVQNRNINVSISISTHGTVKQKLAKSMNMFLYAE